jgi:hypothetical protein
MDALPIAELDRACRVFLRLAYPGGEQAVPAAKRAYLSLAAGPSPEALLGPPVGQKLPAPGGGVRGYALRLGCVHYPHLKLQVTACATPGTWVFAVDTHDTVQLPPDDPEAPRLAQLQAANRRLKEEIERAWDGEGLLTFNGLLRRGL